MKIQAVSPKEMESLTRQGKLAWTAYCLEKGWGTAFPDDEEYIAVPQPTLSQLLIYLQDKKKEWYLSYMDKEPLEVVWPLVKQDLES